MRMWLCDPGILCRRHLLGEHVEMHMFLGSIKKGIGMVGYIRNDLVEPALIINRHERLKNEMLIRGYCHNSPMEVDEHFLLLDLLPSDILNHKIDREKALAQLLTRCDECRTNYRRFIE